MEQIDCVVIGAGVVGLAVARQLAMVGREVIILEKELLIGSETSSRNSEVIHAGIYYPTGSLKARLCVAGKRFLYGYCAEKGISHKACGKLIVATDDEQVPRLEAIRQKAAANGVDDLEHWSRERATALEPELFCTGALWSPSTGLIDSHGLMLAYQGDAEDHGAFLALNAPVLAGRGTADGIVLEVGGEEPMELQAKLVVNSAGLHAPDLARKLEGIDKAAVPRAYYCKGNYYVLPGRSPFARPIYPMPHKDGLGVHITVDLGGQCKFGPDVEWVDGIDYEVDPKRAEVFYDAVRRYWPKLSDGALERGYSGMRPKITPPEAPPADFTFQGPEEHGLAGLINLFAIESPGLTASAAIAEHILAMAVERGL